MKSIARIGVLALLALSALGSSLAVPASAAIPLDLAEYESSWFTFHGEDFEGPAAPGGYRPGEGIGPAVASGCDVTGDDLPDLIVGAPFATADGTKEAGRVYVVPGSPSRPAGDYSLAGVPSLAAAGAIRIDGRADRVGLGAAVACAGDVNGDGAEDLLLGEWGGNENAYGMAAYVVFGGGLPAGGLDLAAALAGDGGFEIWDSTDTTWPGDRFAALGDVTGDGRDDLAIGDYFTSAVVVVAGKADGATVDLSGQGAGVMKILAPNGGADSLTSVAGAGDVDGDDVPDLLVGVPTHDGPNGTDSGAAFVVSGGARGDVDLSDWNQPGSGVLFPVWGPDPTVVNATEVSTGRAVAGAGDLNGDGLADLAIGAPATGPQLAPGARHGSVWVVFGSADGDAVDLAALGSRGYPIGGRGFVESSDRFGSALANAGDVDGDGRDDLLIGAQGSEGSHGEYAAGAAYLVRGQAVTRPVDADALECGEGARLLAAGANRRLGIAVAASTGVFGTDPELIVGAGSTSPESVGGFVRSIPLADVLGACDAEEPPVGSGDAPEVDWGFRENFRRYVYNGFDPADPAVPIAASGGAFCPANPDTAKGGCSPHLKALSSDPVRPGALRFTPVGAGATDGSDTTVATIGRVTFRYPGHFFALTIEDPWFAIEGGEVAVRARADLDVAPGFAGAQSADVRVDLGTFPLEGAAEVSSGYVKWQTGPGFLSPEASAALGSFLGSGAELDPIALTIPRGIAALPEEPGLPIVPDPVDRPGANEGLGGGGGSNGGGGSATAAPAAGASAPPRGRPVGADGIARLTKLACRAESCAVRAPKRVPVKIGGKRFWAKVLAPKVLAKGQKRPLRVRLPRPALILLDGRSTTVKVRVAVRSGPRTLVRVLTLRVRYVPGAKGGSAKGGSGGSAGADGPKSGPIASAEPPALARPASAVDVGNVRITWFPRDSWVRYASSGVAPGDGIKVGNGATALESKASPCPDRPSTSDALLAYGVQFAPKASWYDPVSGSAGIYGQGSVGFRWAAHTIDLTASDPEIEIAGAASRAIFRFSGTGGTPYPNQRASLVSLDAAGRPAVSNGGKTFTYSLMRGTLTADGVNVFAGFYTPPDNDEFGCVSVEFTTP